MLLSWFEGFNDDESGGARRNGVCFAISKISVLASALAAATMYLGCYNKAGQKFAV